MTYIRDHYGVPAKRGGLIEYSGDGPPIRGKITGSRDSYLRVRLDDGRRGTLHPTWKVEYLECACPGYEATAVHSFVSITKKENTRKEADEDEKK